MNRLAKWILRGWSLICLIGLAVSLAHTIPTLRHAIDNDERELATIAIAFGAAKWIGVWAAVLVPIGILHLISKAKRRRTNSSPDGAFGVLDGQLASWEKVY